MYVVWQTRHGAHTGSQREESGESQFQGSLWRATLSRKAWMPIWGLSTESDCVGPCQGPCLPTWKLGGERGSCPLSYHFVDYPALPVLGRTRLEHYSRPFLHGWLPAQATIPANPRRSRRVQRLTHPLWRTTPRDPHVHRHAGDAVGRVHDRVDANATSSGSSC